MNNLRQESQTYKPYNMHIRLCLHFMTECRFVVGQMVSLEFVCALYARALHFHLNIPFWHRWCRWFSFIGIFIFVFFFLFIFIKLPVCKSPSQNHDLFYAVQMLCFALVLFFVCLSFWFKPTRRVYLFTVCVLPGLVIFSYHFLHLSLMLDLICLKYLLVYSTRFGLSIGVNISLEC